MTKEIMDKAEKALASARILLGAGDSDGALNRAYYAMLDGAIAALEWAGAGMTQGAHKTHSELIGSFGMQRVRTRRLPSERGRSLNRVQELRTTGDYMAAPVPLGRRIRTTHDGQYLDDVIR